MPKKLLNSDLWELPLGVPQSHNWMKRSGGMATKEHFAECPPGRPVVSSLLDLGLLILFLLKPRFLQLAVVSSDKPLLLVVVSSSSLK